MRRMFLACAMIFGFGAMVLSGGVANAQSDGVAFTVHSASCPIDFEGGFYETCHDNFLGDAVFTLTADGMSAVEITSGADGVGEALILAGLTSADEAVLTIAAPSGGWAYCKDQISGIVLSDGSIPETGEIALGTLLTTQWVICDVFQYPAEVLPPVVSANG